MKLSVSHQYSLVLVFSNAVYFGCKRMFALVQVHFSVYFIAELKTNIITNLTYDELLSIANKSSFAFEKSEVII